MHNLEMANGITNHQQFLNQGGHQVLPFPTGNDKIIMFSDKDEEEAFSWRGDPDTNFSDWSIEINNTDVYHVHRLVFSIGDRKCDYFSAVFRGNHAEAASHHSKIQLEDRTVANAFPLFLDYVYKLSTFHLERKTVVALIELADYFVCPLLTEICINFVIGEMLEVEEKDIDATKALDYLIQFHEVGHGNIVEIILPVFFGNLDEVMEQLFGKKTSEGRKTRSSDRIAGTTSSTQFHVTTHLFDFIMASSHLEHAGMAHGHSIATSEFVSRYLTEHNPEALYLDRLLKSTHINIMPVMAAEAASSFLEMIKRVPTQEDSDWDSLTKLAVRCYDALSAEDESNYPSATSLVDDFVKGKTTRLSHMLATARLSAFALRQDIEKASKTIDISEEGDDDEEEAFEPESGEEHEDIYMNESEEDDFEVDAGIMLIRGRDAMDPTIGV
jgi:hypothetical protein